MLRMPFAGQNQFFDVFAQKCYFGQREKRAGKIWSFDLEPDLSNFKDLDNYLDVARFCLESIRSS